MYRVHSRTLHITPSKAFVSPLLHESSLSFSFSFFFFFSCFSCSCLSKLLISPSLHCDCHRHDHTITIACSSLSSPLRPLSGGNPAYIAPTIMTLSLAEEINAATKSVPSFLNCANGVGHSPDYMLTPASPDRIIQL